MVWVNRILHRLKQGSLAPNGFVYPGNLHTMSGPVSGRPPMVAALRSDGTIRVFNEANPGQVIYSLLPGDGVQFTRIEFQPGTSNLWIAVKIDNEVYVTFRNIPAPAAIASFVTDSAAVSETLEVPLPSPGGVPDYRVQGPDDSVVPLPASPQVPISLGSPVVESPSPDDTTTTSVAPVSPTSVTPAPPAPGATVTTVTTVRPRVTDKSAVLKKPKSFPKKRRIPVR